jgi:general secretion pathway protein I
MVALVVVALALPALLLTVQQQLDGSAYLRDKAIAQLVASNKLTELRLLRDTGGDVFSGDDSGAIEMAGRDWFWRASSSATELPRFYRVEVSVSDREGDDEPPLVTLSGFLRDAR